MGIYLFHTQLYYFSGDCLHFYPKDSKMDIQRKFLFLFLEVAINHTVITCCILFINIFEKLNFLSL